MLPLEAIEENLFLGLFQLPEPHSLLAYLLFAPFLHLHSQEWHLASGPISIFCVKSPCLPLIQTYVFALRFYHIIQNHCPSQDPYLNLYVNSLLP